MLLELLRGVLGESLTRTHVSHLKGWLTSNGLNQAFTGRICCILNHLYL